MTPSPLPITSPTLAPPVSLRVILRAESKGQLLTREPVTDSDLADARAEAWRECFLRKGRTDVSLASTAFQLVPILRENSESICTGFALEHTLRDGPAVRHEFNNRCLADVATRASGRLVEFNVLKAGQPFVYEIETASPPHPTLQSHPDDSRFSITMHSSPLHTLNVPLRPMLQQSRTENVMDDALFPVFFTEEALRSAERCSRKGSDANPPVETGAALAGVLCSSPCGEFFTVVTDVLEAVDAEKTEFSLTFSSQSWNRIQTVTKARQSVQPTFRILGQAHGHNFIPNNGKTCEACPTRPTCDLTNLFVSADDRTWTRAVFSQQPWGLCLIYGLTARGDKLRGLWCQHDGRLRERGFFVLPKFDPDQWEMKS